MSDDQLDKVVSLPRLPPRSKARPALGNSPSGSSTPVFQTAHSSRDDIVHIHIDDHDSIAVDGGETIDFHDGTDRLATSAKLSPPLSSPSSASSVSSSPAISPSVVSSPVDWKFPTSISVHASLPDTPSKRSSAQSTFVPLSPEIDPSGPVPKRPASSGVYTPASFPGPSGSARELSSSPIGKIDSQNVVRPPLLTSGSSTFFARSRSYLAYINPSSYLGSSVTSTSPMPPALASDSALTQSTALGKGSISSSGVYTPMSYHEQQIRIASRNMTDPAVSGVSGGPAAFPLLSPRIISASRNSFSFPTSESVSSQTDQISIDGRTRASSIGSSLSVEELPLRVKKKSSNIARKPLPATLHTDNKEDHTEIPNPDSSSVQTQPSVNLIPSPSTSDLTRSDQVGRDQSQDSKPIVELKVTSEKPPITLPSQTGPSGGAGMAALPNKEMRTMEVDKPTEEMLVGRVW